MYVIPEEGRSVPDPAAGDFLPAEGRNVAETSYWYRRLASGEVTLPATEPELPSPVQPDRKTRKS